MEVLLVQHGEAKSEEEDSHRPLTEKGRREVAAVAVALKRHGVGVESIWHSGKLRASQTAAALAEALEPSEGVVEKRGLAPGDDPAGTAEALAGMDASVVVVGHLPHLDRLTSLLLTGDPDRGLVRFRQGGALCLARVDPGWRVDWYLTPELAEVVTA